MRIWLHDVGILVLLAF